METYTLHQLNEFIRRILALNLPDALWLRCEIAQVSESRGHYFLSLVEKSEETDEIIAQSEAVLWQGRFRRLRQRIGRELPELLQDGREVRLLVRVDFNERYGLKLVIEDIDPAYTLGQLEMVRLQTLKKLREQGLLTRNAENPLPPVPQRIALLSSETAAGLQDFQRQLTHNPYRYQFADQLFPVAVQGKQVETEVIQQLGRIKRRRASFDCIVLIRGGGSRLDLSAFDSFELCRAIAECPLPVLTGIGHDVDETLADQVAHTALKTPTAAADFLIDRCLAFESRLLEMAQQLTWITRERLQNQALRLQKLEQDHRFQTHRLLTEQQRTLDFIENEIPHLLRYRLRDSRAELDRLGEAVHLLSPSAILRRGFTLTLHNGRPVQSASELQPGDRLLTRFKDGVVESDVTTTPDKPKPDA